MDDHSELKTSSLSVHASHNDKLVCKLHNPFTTKGLTDRQTDKVSNVVSFLLKVLRYVGHALYYINTFWNQII